MTFQERVSAIENSVYDAEFVALEIGMEILRGQADDGGFIGRTIFDLWG